MGVFLSRSGKPSHKPSVPTLAPRRRLTVEQLEDRLAPALFEPTQGNFLTLAGSDVRTAASLDHDLRSYEQQYVDYAQNYAFASNKGSLTNGATKFEESAWSTMYYVLFLNTLYNPLPAKTSSTATLHISPTGSETNDTPVIVELSLDTTVWLSGFGGYTSFNMSIGDKTVADLHYSDATTDYHYSVSFPAKVGDDVHIVSKTDGGSRTGALTQYPGPSNLYTYSISLKPDPSSLSVKATYDEESNGDKVFGTYLSGVKLNNEFEVSVTGSAIKKLRIDVPGTEFDATLNVAANGTTNFPFDPGKFPAGTLDFTVTPLDAGGIKIGDNYEGKIKVIDKLPFTLQAEVPGTGLVDASEVRLVAGVANAPNIKFVATANNVPLPDTYLPRLTVWFNVLSDADGPEFFGPTTFGTGTVEFPVTANVFGNTVTALSKFDWEAYLGPTTPFSEKPEPIHLGENASARVFTIAKPEWLANATAEYSSANPISQALGQGTLGYAFKLQTAKLDISLPGLTGSLADWFGDLKSGIFSGLDVYLFARLTGKPGDAKFAVGDWTFKVTLLGDTIFDDYFKPEQLNLTVDGTLANARTLTGVSTLIVSTTDPINLLNRLGNDKRIDWVFGNNTDPKKKWQISGHSGIVSATLSLSGKLYAELDELGAIGSVTFALDNKNTFSLDKKKSWVQLNVKAHAHLEFTGTASLGLDLLIIDPVNFVEARLRSTVDVAFSGQFRVTLDKPGDLDKANSWAGLKLTVMFEYAFILVNGIPDYMPFTKEPIIYGPFRLFHLSLPPGW